MTAARRSAAAATLAVAALLLGAGAPSAQAAVSPPALTAFFAQDIAAPGGPAGLTLTVADPDPVTTQTGVGFSATLPSGLTISTPSELDTSCGGTASAPDGGSTITLSGATLQPAGSDGDSCFVLLDVVGSQPGSFSLIAGPASSNESGPGAPSNTTMLEILAAPTMDLSFVAPTIKVGATTTATFTVHNANASTTLYNLAFADALPAGLKVAATPNLTQTCQTASISADPGAASVALLDLSLDAGTQCSFSVDVSATAATSAPNSTGPLSYAFDNGSGDFDGATAPGTSATLVAVGSPVLTAGFGAASIAVNAMTPLTFTLSNPNATAALTGVAFSDALPDGVVVATPNGLSSSCSAATITAAAGSSSITFGGGSLAIGASCTATIGVKALTAGQKAITTSAVTSNEGGPGAAASASLLVAQPGLGVVPPPPPPPPPPPTSPRPVSNSFTVAHTRATKSGTISFDLSLPGAGDLSVLETLSIPSAQHAATPGHSRFTMARKHVHVTKAGKLRVTVKPNARAKRAIKRAKHALRASVSVTFSPKGGRPRTVHKTVLIHPR